MAEQNDPVVYLDVKDLAHDLQEISELSPEQITNNILHDFGKSITQKAQENAPRKTGRLASSISYTVNGDQLVIEVKAPYGMYQEFGTGTRGEFNGSAYTIKPKKGKYLKFKAGGRTIYTKQVTHPGIPARPFLRPAVTEALGPLFDKLAERGQAMILKGPNSNL